MLIGKIPLGTLSGWTLVTIVLVAFIKGWPAFKKMQIDGDVSLRADLLARIVRLEDAVAHERQTCTEQISALRFDYESRIAAQGRQIDSLQRELFILRAASLSVADKMPTNAELESLVRKLNEEQDDG